MKKIIVGLFFGAFMHAAEMPEAYIFNNVARGYTGGWNFEVIKKIGDDSIRRVVAYEELSIIGLSSENITSLDYRKYGEFTGDQNLNSFTDLLQRPGAGFVGIDVSAKSSVTLSGLKTDFPKNYRLFGINQLVPVNLLNNSVLYEKFKTNSYDFLGSRAIIGRGLIRGVRNQFYRAIDPETYDILFACFPGLAVRGTFYGSKKETFNENSIYNVARYILGLPKPDPNNPIRRAELENAYKLTKLKWQLLADYYSQQNQIQAQENCINLIDFIDAAYQEINNIFGREEEKSRVELQKEIDVPESYPDEVLGKLNLKRPATAYDVLGLDERATVGQIEKKGRTLQGAWSPDRNKDPEVRKLITWARQILTEIKSRESE